MAIGNPWGAAAQSYGQDVDQLTKIQMGGMQQAAQMPLQLYDRFMDGYERARQRAAQEKAEELRQAQFERQQKLAEETLRHNQANELFARDRMAQQDVAGARKEAMDYEANFNARVPGSKDRLTALLQAARMPTTNIPEVETAPNGGMPLPGPVRPGEDPLVVQGENPLSGYGPAAYAKEQELQRKIAKDLDARATTARTDSRLRMEIERKEKADAARQDHQTALLGAALGKGEVRDSADGLVVVDPRTGKARPVVGDDGKPIKGTKTGGSSRERVTAIKDLAVFDEIDRLVDAAMAELEANPQAVGPHRGIPGKIGELINQVADPKGIRARAILSDLKSSRLKQRIGGAQTKIELQNLIPMVPSQDDWSAGVTKTKLALFKEAAKAQREVLKARYGIADDEKPPADDPPPPGGGEYSVSYNGKTYRFPNQKALDGFKSEVGIR